MGVDVCPETAGTLMGLSNTIGTVPGIVGQPITQALLDATGSWSVVFGIGGAVGILAALFFACFADDISLDPTPTPRKEENEEDELAWEVGRSSSGLSEPDGAVI